jgi:hypothetical protein
VNSERDRGKIRWPALLLLSILISSSTLVLSFNVFASEDSATRVVTKDCNITVTGNAQPRFIVRSGNVRPGEFVKPDQGCVAYLIDASGIQLLDTTRSTLIAPVPGENSVFASTGMTLPNIFERLALPREEWSTPGITKGDDLANAGLYRIVYPRSTRVAGYSPVLVWAGGSDRFEILLYEKGIDEWIWKQKVIGKHQVTVDASRLQSGQTYTWEVRDLKDPMNVELAVFQTPTDIERQNLDIKILDLKSHCPNNTSKIMCELALAGLYRSEGYLYDSIRVLEATSFSPTHDATIQSLLHDLRN